MDQDSKRPRLDEEVIAEHYEQHEQHHEPDLQPRHPNAEVHNDQNNLKPYNLEKVKDIRVVKYGIEEYSYRARFNLEGNEPIADFEQHVHAMFEDVLKEAKHEQNTSDKMRVNINHQSLDKPITIHLQPQANITADTILQRFTAVMKSKKEIKGDETFDISLGTLRRDEGGGGTHKVLCGVNTSEDLTLNSVSRKKSMVYIPMIPGEQICCARAVVTCKAKIDGMPRRKFDYFKSKNYAHTASLATQKGQALALLSAVGLSKDEPVALRQLHLLEDYLDIQIIVISSDLLNEVCYTGVRERERKIYLYLTREHYHSITCIEKFHPSKRLCTQCLKWYGRKARYHSCRTKCNVCNRSGCAFDSSTPSVTCNDCNLVCRNQECFQVHKITGTYQAGPNAGEPRPASPCDTFYRCEHCGVTINRLNRDLSEHKCGEFFCRNCKTYVDQHHLCYYRIKQPKNTSGFFLYYDYECSQDTIYQCHKGYSYKAKEDCKKCESLDNGRLCGDCRRCVNCMKSYCGRKQFLPIFLVCQTTCDMCENNEWYNDSMCGSCGDRCSMCSKRDKEGRFAPLCNNGACGKREKVFSGPSTNSDFCNWLFTPRHKGYICLAHNSRSFDAHFVLNHLVSNGVTPSVIYDGGKIMRLHVGSGLNITLLDSLSFLPMKLANLPSALGLGTELEKGTFPYLYCTEDHFNNVLDGLPDMKYYSPDFMSTKDRADFLRWYEERKDQPFDFQEEILAYTRSDVVILREACTKFRQLVKEVTTLPGSQSSPVDVFAHVTLASSAMQIIRQLIMWEKHQVKMIDGTYVPARLKAGVWIHDLTDEIIHNDSIEHTRFLTSQIPQPPVHGYHKQHNHSRKAIVWLEYISATKLDNRKLMHARRGGEFNVPGTRYFTDGYDVSTGETYDFYGCRWHGHGCLAARLARDPHSRHNMEQLLAMTKLRESKIREVTSSRHRTIWECDFDKMMKEDPILRQISADLDLPETPMRVRDALYGGRTEPIRLMHTCTPDEEMKYLDFCSLYPFCNWFGSYPVCHPEILTDDKIIDHTLGSYTGVAQVKILPSSDLFLPVLPYRAGNKLMFPLCRTCCERESLEECKCSDEERVLVGTWVIAEILKAVEKGYQILKVYTVYHYPEMSQYNSHTGQGGLFQEYVRIFLRLKQEASSWPPGVETERQKEEYIKFYKDFQGVELRPENICKNPGLRLTAKIYLNSAWGKFCQDHRKVNTVFISTTDKFVQVKNDPTKELVDFHIVNDEVIAVDIKSRESFNDDLTFQNDIVGALTTAYARLQLYQALEVVGERSIYMDTDSLVFVQKKGDDLLPTGSLLGDLTDEIDPGVTMTDFACSGPKSYSYKLSNKEEVVKLKGISLNFTNSLMFNYNLFEKVVAGKLASINTPLDHQFCRVKYRGILYKRPYTKSFKMTFNKRIIPKAGCHISVPYGYRGIVPST